MGNGNQPDDETNIRLRTPFQNFIRYKVLPGKEIEQSINPSNLYNLQSQSINQSVWLNRYHWIGQERFLEGWYHRVVVDDPISGFPTTFFLLVGVNNPSGKPNEHAKSFVICGNAVENSTVPASPYSTPFANRAFIANYHTPGRLFEKYIPITEPKAFWADNNESILPRGPGMNVEVGSAKSNSVYADLREYRIRGKVIDDQDNWMVWDIYVTLGEVGAIFFLILWKSSLLLLA